MITTKLLTNREIAEHLGVSNQTVSKWIREKKLPQPKRAGRICRHRLDDVYAAIVEHQLYCTDDVRELAERSVSEPVT